MNKLGSYIDDVRETKLEENLKIVISRFDIYSSPLVPMKSYVAASGIQIKTNGTSFYLLKFQFQFQVV